MKNLVLTKKETSDLQTTESNIIKIAMGLGIRTETSELLYTMKFEPIKDRLAISKCNLMMRLVKNSFSLEIIKQITQMRISSIHKKGLIRDILILTSPTDLEINAIMQACMEIITDLKLKMKLCELDANIKKSKISSSILNANFGLLN